MPIYICTCEDEAITNNCSGECDLCIHGHTDEEFCTCADCDELNNKEDNLN